MIKKVERITTNIFTASTEILDHEFSTSTLPTNGSLGNIRAEERASTTVRLMERPDDKPPLLFLEPFSSPYPITGPPLGPAIYVNHQSNVG